MVIMNLVDSSKYCAASGNLCEAKDFTMQLYCRCVEKFTFCHCWIVVPWGTTRPPRLSKEWIQRLLTLWWYTWSAVSCHGGDYQLNSNAQLQDPGDRNCCREFHSLALAQNTYQMPDDLVHEVRVDWWRLASWHGSRSDGYPIIQRWN